MPPGVPAKCLAETGSSSRNSVSNAFHSHWKFLGLEGLWKLSHNLLGYH